VGPCRSPICLKVYRNLAESDLLAQLGGNEFKVLLCLGLEATQLGVSPRSDGHCQWLPGLGAVTPADRGRLCCQLPRDTLAHRCGLSLRAVGTAVKMLAARWLIEKRRVRGPNGRRCFSVYLVRRKSHLVRFSFNRHGPARAGPLWPGNQASISRAAPKVTATATRAIHRFIAFSFISEHRTWYQKARTEAPASP
jgi:hypothetical protein